MPRLVAAAVLLLAALCSCRPPRPSAPPATDTDRDGIPDHRDACPTVPERYDHPDKTPETADGCPGTRPFTYCTVKLVGLKWLADDRLAASSAKQVIALAREGLRRGGGNHHLFIGLDVTAAGDRRRLREVRVAAKRGGLGEGQVRSEHPTSACEHAAWPAGARARKTVPSNPPLVLIRVQWTPCQ